jgi:hypothetical protein
MGCHQAARFFILHNIITLAITEIGTIMVMLRTNYCRMMWEKLEKYSNMMKKSG